jgi:hypothetical protein
MHDAPLFGGWSDFYVITGSSSAALTGLMFVSVTIIAGRRTDPDQQRTATATYSTPTIIHFCGAFLVSVVMTAPWAAVLYAKIILALAGFAGVVYTVRVLLRARTLTVYRPDAEDWTWVIILPIVAYVAIVVSALLLSPTAPGPLFAIGAAAVLLIFIGIHNAWDVVTYVAIEFQDD